MPRQAAQGRTSGNAGLNTGGVEAAVIIFPGVRYERPGEGGARSQTVSIVRPQSPSGKPQPRH